MKLWVDNVRSPPKAEDWVWVKDQESFARVLECSEPEFVSFGSNLGLKPVLYVIKNKKNLKRFKWQVHSDSLTGNLISVILSLVVRW